MNIDRHDAMKAMDEIRIIEEKMMEDAMNIMIKFKIPMELGAPMICDSVKSMYDSLAQTNTEMGLKTSLSDVLEELKNKSKL